MSCACNSMPVATTATPNIVPSTVVNGLRGVRGLRGLGEFQQRAWRDDNWLGNNSNFRLIEAGAAPIAPLSNGVVPGVSNTTLAVGGLGTLAALAAAYYAWKKLS